MPDIHLEREHKLGLAKARKLALQWAELAEQKFGMACTILEGKTSDTVEFTRSGVTGELLVEANRFTVDAKFGFLIGAFSKTIEAEIEKNLEGLLDKASAAATSKPASTTTAAPVKKAAAKKAVVKKPPAASK